MTSPAPSLPSPHQLARFTVLIALGASTLQAQSPEAMDRARMEAVVQFAETVLKHGRDTYGEKHTPLFVDTLDVDTMRAPEKMYIFRLNKPGPRQWQPWQPVVSSNVAYQGNLMRVLAGLSKVTGDPKYKDAYKESIRYYFQHYQNESGMLHTGHHRFIDLKADKYDGDDWPSGSRGHEMKGDMPYYDLFWETDQEATQRMLEGHWNSHLKNWETMDFTRHGSYGRKLGDGVWDREMAEPVKGIIKGDLTFFGSFTDIAWAGGSLGLLGKDEKPRRWTERLLARYIDSRHPETGIPPCHHTEVRDFAAGNGYPNEKWPEYALIFSGPSESMFCFGATMLLRLGESYGEKDGSYFTKSVCNYLKAYANQAYNPEDNTLRTILYDGRDLSVLPRKGDGPPGLLFPPWKAHGGYLLSYALGYRLTKDPDLWRTLRGICRGNDLGEIGPELNLNMATESSDPFSIFALVELFRASNNRTYLDLARVVANNALKNSYDQEKGLFVRSDLHKTASLNVREPLAFLTLEAALGGKLNQVPTYDGSTVGYLYNMLRSRKVLPYEPTVSHHWYPDAVTALCDELIPKNSNDNSIPRLTWYRGKHQESVVATFPDLIEKPVTVIGPSDATDAPNLLKGITLDSPHGYRFAAPGSLKMQEDFTLQVRRGHHSWAKSMAWYPSGSMNYIFDIAAASSFTFEGMIYEYYHPNTRTGVIKDGQGTLTITEDYAPLIRDKKEDDRAYQGATVIKRGLLLVNNTSGSGISPKSAVRVEDGGTLGGAGAIGKGGTSALVTVEAGGTIAPGNSPPPLPFSPATIQLGGGGVGTLTLRDGLTLEDGAHLTFEFGKTGDLLKVTGGTFKGSGKGGVKVSIQSFSGVAIGETYDLIDWTGAKAEGVEAEDFTFDRSSLYFGGFTIEDKRLRIQIGSPASAPGMRTSP